MFRDCNQPTQRVEGTVRPRLKDLGFLTSFLEPVQYYNDHRKDYTTMVYFTDGYGDQDECKPMGEMIWVITSNGYQEGKFPGKTILIPKKKH